MSTKNGSHFVGHPLAGVCILAFTAVLSGGGLFAAATPVYDDDVTPTVMTVTVAEGADTLDVAIPATVTKFIKLGAGKLTLTKAALWANDVGTVEVQAGTLVPGTYANMGTPATVTVSADATLDFTGLAKDLFATSYVKTIFNVTGSGYEGQGALRYTDDKNKCHALLKRIVMTGDTKVVGPTYYSDQARTKQKDIGANDGFGFGQYGSSNPLPNLNMNGHTLTIEGAFCIGNSSAASKNTISNPGNIVVLANGRLLLPSMDNLTVDGTGTATWPAFNSKTITLNNGAQMMHYMVRDSPTLTWKVVVPAGAEARFFVRSNNDIKRGYVYYPFEVNGTLVLHEAEEATHSMRLFSPLTGCGKVISESKGGANAEGVIRYPTLSNHPFDRQIGELAVTKGVAEFQDTGLVSVTNYYTNNSELYGKAETVVGGQSFDRFLPILRLAGRTHFGVPDGHPERHAIMVGKDKYGVLDVSGGATVSNMIYMARQNGDYGAIWLSGETSEIYWPSTLAYSRSLIGDMGYGCMMMANGKVTMDGIRILLGRNGGSGYWVQTNGTTTVKGSYFWLARPSGSSESSGDLHVSGGLFDARDNIELLNPDSGSNWSGPRAVLTVGGGTIPAMIQTPELKVSATTNAAGAVAIVNVNSNGMLKVGRMGFVTPSSGAFAAPGKTLPETRFYLNFNGGTLAFAKSANFFYDGKSAPNRIVVYGGGAVLDTAGFDVGFDAALIRPKGQGIASVTLPAEEMGTTGYYIGASRIYVNAAADAEGATVSGLTCFDPSTRSVTGVAVSCPGYDLPQSPAVKVRSRTRSVLACTCTLADLPTTGGVTKKGAGTLTLKGANTYGGTTRIEGGTLAFTHADGLPGNDIEFSAEAVAAATPGTPLLVAERLALDAGKKIRITGVDRLPAETFGRMRTLVSVMTPMTAMPTVELVDSNGQVVTSGDWHFSLSPDGKALKFGLARGLVITVR